MKSASNAPRVVVLTGPMGAGKSAVGAQLARKSLGNFLDTDHVIEQRAGKKIAEIFAVDGEATFRAMEEEICVELIQTAGPSTVLALGGGAFMNAAIREAANAPDVLSVYLCTSPESSWSRIRHSAGGAAKRPLLAHPDPLGRLRELYNQRHEFYSEAKLIIHTDSLYTSDVVHAILAELDAQRRAAEREPRRPID